VEDREGQGFVTDRRYRCYGMASAFMTGVARSAEVWRTRSLASSRRAGSWARVKARRAQYDFIRRRWVSLLGALAGMGLVSGLAVLLVPSGFVRGFASGGLLVAIVGTLWSRVVQVTGTASIMMGDEAEQWSAAELRKLQRRGWRVVNGVCLRQWDIDHVLVGPGGVIAVETKWSASPWTDADGGRRIAAATARVQRSAKDLRLWADLRKIGVDSVSSVVLLWGAGAQDIEPTVEVALGGTTAVLAGLHMEDWRRSLPVGVLDHAQIADAWAALERQCRVRDARDRNQAPTPPSISGMAFMGVATMSSAAVGLLAAARWLAQLGELRWWGLGGAVLLAPGPLLDRTRVRTAGWAWTFGAAACIPLVVWVFVSAAMR
jgi:hypothetical protein